MAPRLRALLVSCAAGAALAGGIGAAVGGAQGAGLCVYPVSTTQANGKATSTFSISAGCSVQVSLVAVSYTAGGAVLAASATGRFSAGAASGVTSLTVDLPCGNGETDLVLGPPALYPPAPLDLRAVLFSNPCQAPVTQPVQSLPRLKVKVKAKAWCDSGRGNGSEGNPAHRFAPGRDRGPGPKPTLDCDPGHSGGHDHGGD